MPTTPKTSREIRLTWRLAQEKDLESGFALVHDRSLFDPVSRRHLLAFWKNLIRTGACISVVLEDRNQPKGRRMVAFCLTVFGKTDFVGRVKTDSEPGFALRAVQEWRAGRPVYLDRGEIAAANRGNGMTVLTLSQGWVEDRYGDEDYAKIHQMLPESFIATHCGYRIREVLCEAYGQRTKELLARYNFKVVQEYGKNSGPSDRQAYLMGFAGEDSRVGDVAEGIFAKTGTPRFRLKGGEQEVLQRALLGQTEGQVAKALGLSPNTIKKRWQAIYQKVETFDPDLLEVLDIPESERIKKRRSLLLDYLRQHPEELRPSL